MLPGMHRTNCTTSQDFSQKSTFTETVNSRKLGPPMGVMDSKVDSFCGGLTLETNLAGSEVVPAPRKIDVRLPGRGDSNSHGARPVHLIITMTKWFRTSKLSIKNSLSGTCSAPAPPLQLPARTNLRATTSQKCAAVSRRARI